MVYTAFYFGCIGEIGLSRNYAGEDAIFRAKQRREKLFQAGLVCFGSLGYAKTTIKAICKQAELTERYFYESFKNKEALMQVVYSHLMDSLMAELKEIAIANRSEPDLALSLMTRHSFAVLKEKKYRAQVQLFEILGVSEALDVLYQEKVRLMTQSVKDVWEMLFPSLKNAQISPVYFSAIVGAHWQISNEWVLSGYREDIDQLVHAFKAIQMALIKVHL
jgi:AcrR family transcriptional regulator